MPYVARTSPARAKMRGLPEPPRIMRTLRCGHSTDDPPIATNQGRKFFRCPEGCGLQKAR